MKGEEEEWRCGEERRSEEEERRRGVVLELS